MDKQQRDLISKDTRDLIALGAQMISDDWVKLDILKECPLPTHQEALLYTLSRIDWKNADSIRPYLRLLET